MGIGVFYPGQAYPGDAFGNTTTLFQVPPPEHRLPRLQPQVQQPTTCIVDTAYLRHTECYDIVLRQQGISDTPSV